MRDEPAIAIFLTLGLGFWIGRFHYKTFSLGVVTSVLLVGVLIGQLNIPISGPLKSVSFLLFLFAIGYSVGPQFFSSLRGTGLKQVVFALVMCVLCLVVTLGVALLFGYNVGESVGLFAGAQTISAVIGVGDDTINNLSASAADKTAWINMVPICYAVTYIYGTIGSAWLLGSLGPAMLGGIKKVRRQTIELEQKMSQDPLKEDPAFVSADEPVVYRTYRLDNADYDAGITLAKLEERLAATGKRLYIERIRVNGAIPKELDSETVLHNGDVVALGGRREFLAGEEAWLGPEVSDLELLSFSVERINVLLSRKSWNGRTVADFRRDPSMEGVVIANISRAGTAVPVLAQTVLQRGDTLTITGHPAAIKTAATQLGYVDRPSTATDMVFVGLGVFIGALIGAITIHMGGIPISLSTSGGALIAGLVFGWLRSKRPTFGNIPSPSLWIMNNLGLNLFIAVIGISAGPTFISGIQQVGFMLVIAGILATSLPIILGIWIGDKWFHFHPAINLGCVAGSRVTTASLGAIQDAVGSTLPAMGYTITYAVGNTALILMSLIICFVIA